MMENVFSIVVPIYNVEPYINKCVDSILHQNFESFELILVDDGSPDNCPAICDEYLKKNTKVKVVHKTNGGLVSARNAGLEIATGEYVMYVDGDDWILPGTLNDIWEKVIKEYSPDMIIYNMISIYSDKEIKNPCYVEEGFYEGENLKNNIIPYMIYDSRKSFYKGLIFPSCGGKIVRRLILSQHYCRDTRIRMGEDNAFIFECALSSKSIYFINQYYYQYNQLNQSSIRSNYDSKRFENNKYLMDYISEHLKGNGKVVDKQLNVFKAYWLIMAIFHEVKTKQRISYSRKHIREGIEKNQALADINSGELPKFARIFIVLLRLHLYTFTLILAKVINSIREIKNR